MPSLAPQLPRLTLWFIGAGNGLARWFFVIFTAALFATILILGFRRQGGFWRSLFSMFPWLRERFLAPHVSRFSFALGSLLQSGFALPFSLKMAIEASRHPVLIEGEEEMQARLNKGEQIGEILRGERTLPPHFQWLAARAFASGAPEPVLMKLAEDYRASHERTMRRIGAVALPLLVLALGAAVGLFALAVYLPLFNLPQLEGIR